ncbi:hypothetical protein JF729_14665 [Mycobacterium intracellulare]|uniref:hypothetical protein n=1 Tax=Mycobacterium intracellulare TaxID=1767 RepID=UPI001CD9CD9A|nr:hypothetical protein [Mycobacterium intracellulare]MCA2249025.1 hypothetical protein [Mycobacterium intracellulare]
MTDREQNSEDLQAAHFIDGYLSGDVQAQFLFGLQSGLPAPGAMIRIFQALFPEIGADRDAVLSRLRAHIAALLEAQFDEPEDGSV